MKITKKGCKNKLKVVTQIFLRKKKAKAEKMEELNLRICLKKINKS